MDNTNRKIQGMDNYTYTELRDIIQCDLENMFNEWNSEAREEDQISIIDFELHGSRLRGTAREDSDLDVVVSYKGNVREDDLFNYLNYYYWESEDTDEEYNDGYYIDSIKIDINPIQEDLDDYLERDKLYDKKILGENLC